MGVESQRVEEFRLTKEPYYLPLGDEVELFEAAYNAKLARHAQGPDRMRQDPLRRTHELATSAGRSSRSRVTRI